MVVPGGYSLVAVHELLIAVAFLIAEPQALDKRTSEPVAPRLWSIGSVVVTHRLGCHAACGIFPDQGSNPCLLRWQADSLSLSYQGSLDYNI